ncbi:hypothetical protein H2198_009190 [Neophaeococcomyces mojaviensis]|uniref:Uncharacterized protein n=1 Tax=Neophaeococcomyces mojaviensis TaxID=3383035 RepID=A0ACC2ZV72_9EURO|nr:hypothetical protein H2198_009190 [Knufia sp. JES_112]
MDYCGNLVTTDVTNRRIEFTHASVKTFLQDTELLPPDLVEFRINIQSDDLWCAELCFSYFDFLHSRKQLAPRQEISIPGDVSQAFLQSIPFARTTGLVSRMFAKRTTSPSRTKAIPVPTRVLQVAELHMHSYFVKFWLSHTSNITSGAACYSRFRRCCLSFDRELFHWLDTTTTNGGLYQHILQHAVLESHGPMLHVVTEHIKREKPNLIASIFRSPCPGTSAHLIHMAAALGETDAVAELKPFSRVDALDEQGRTPLAWAAENSHFGVVEFLISEAGANVGVCRRISTDPIIPTYHDPSCSLSLLTVLVDQETPDAFWHFSQHLSHLLKPCLSKPLTSQALFAACRKGHVDIAKQLIQLGADPTHYTRFAWPGLDDRIQGWPLLANLDFLGVDAAATLLTAYSPLKPPTTETAEGLINRIFALPARDAAHFAAILCNPQTISLLRSKFVSTWLTITIRACASSTPAFATHWRALARAVVRLETSWYDYTLERDPDTWQEMLGGHYVQDWLQVVPDDVLTMLIRAGHLVQCDRKMNFPYTFLQALSCRMSSRPLIAWSQVWIDQSWEPLAWDFPIKDHCEALTNAHKNGNRETIEFMLYRGSQTIFGHFLWRRYVQTIDPKNILRMSNLPIPSAVRAVRAGLGDKRMRTLTPYYLCFRALRYCKQDVMKAVKWIRDLKDVNPEFDLSLNFPAGYWKVGERYAVKLSIVGALYRWNWRLRRRKGLPLSNAEAAYSLAVPECWQDFRMPDFLKQTVDSRFLQNLQQDLSGPIQFNSTKQQRAAFLLRIFLRDRQRYTEWLNIDWAQ